MGGRIALESTPGAGSTFEVSVPLTAAEGNGRQAFAPPDLSGQSIMLVAPQSIEPSLISRRLQRWGAQTCLVSDLAVAQALLPERAWQAVLVDHAFGAADIEAFGEAARGHATQRIVISRRRRGRSCSRPRHPPSPAIWSSRCAQLPLRA
jgi:hypothetical protein